MFSAFGRYVVTTALVCTGAAAGVPLGAAATAPEWEPPVTLAPTGATRAVSAVSVDGDIAVGWERAGAVELARRPVDGVWGPTESVATHGAAPQLAFASDGRVLVAWSDARPGRPTRLRLRHTKADGTWAAATTVARRDSRSIQVEELAVNDSHEAVLGWTWGRRGLVSRGRVAGRWTTDARWPATLDVDVALGNSGLAAVMLHRYEPPLRDDVTLTFEVARQPRAGAWSSTKVLQRVAQSPPWVGPGDVAVDGQGTTTAAWRHRTSRGWQIRTVRAPEGRRLRGVSAIASKPGFSEYGVRVLATPAGEVLAVWARHLYNGLSSARRPADGPWTSPLAIARGDGIVVGWDVALDPSGRAAAAVARARRFGWGYGTAVTLMNRRGVWTVPQKLTSATFDPTVAMGHQDAIATWIGARGLRASIHLHP